MLAIKDILHISDTNMLGGSQRVQLQARSQGGQGAAAPRKKLNPRKNKPPSPHGRLVTGLCL